MLFSFTGRYEAPEVFKNEEYDTKVDVFSFALILQEVYIPLLNSILFYVLAGKCFSKNLYIEVAHVCKLNFFNFREWQLFVDVAFNDLERR